MKMTSTLLLDFIHDFDLKSSEVGVCFDAVIDFNIKSRKLNFQSEILMDSFLLIHPDTVYILNPIARVYDIPTFFNDVNHQFIYFKSRGLFIAGYSAFFGAYSISIFPVSRDCSKKTFEELKVKKFN